jgi:HK97 family phage prohead protease
MDAIDERAVWSTAYVNDLPDSAFLYVESGGKKDSEGKTTPRSLRHFPYKDANGNVDLPHLRNALARIPQSNLPAEVKAAATKKAEALLKKHGGERTSQQDAELRYAVAPITHIEVRDPTANPDDTWTMSGYAAVFNRSTVLYDGSFLVRSEEIDPGFFDPIFRDQPLSQPDGVVHFNYGHDMLSSVAASDVPAGQPGSLVLRADAHGLHFLAKVPRDDPDGVRMAAKMRSGVLKQASFAFTIANKETSTRELDDGRVEERDRLLAAGRLYDVCATPQGAYPQTVSSLRSYAAALGQSTLVEAQEISAIQAGLSPVSPSSGAGAAKRKFEAQIMRDELARKYRK